MFGVDTDRDLRVNRSNFDVYGCGCGLSRLCVLYVVHWFVNGHVHVAYLGSTVERTVYTWVLRVAQEDVVFLA